MLHEVRLVSQRHEASRVIQISGTCPATQDHSDIQACNAAKSMSGSEALKQQGSVLISMAPANTKGHEDTWDLINHLKLCDVQELCCYLGQTDLGGWC